MFWAVKILKNDAKDAKTFILNLASLESLIDVKMANQNLGKITGENLPPHEIAYNAAVALKIDIKEGLAILTSVINHLSTSARLSA